MILLSKSTKHFLKIACPDSAFEYSGIRGLFIQVYGTLVSQHGYKVSCLPECLVFGMLTRSLPGAGKAREGMKKKLLNDCTKTYTVSGCNPSVSCPIIPLFQGNFRDSVKTILQFLGILVS